MSSDHFVKTKPKILIGLPTMFSIHTLLAVTIMSWVIDSYNTGEYDISVYPTLGIQPVDNARNQIADEFLQGDCTHLFFIDADTIPPPDALRRLLAHNLPIVSGLTPIPELDEKSDKFYRKWNCVGEDDKFLSPNKGLVPIKGAGGSCILIKREVFEQLEKPFYRFVYEDDDKKPVSVGEDIYFIIKAIGKGIKPFADTDIICKHFKPTMW